MKVWFTAIQLVQAQCMAIVEILVNNFRFVFFFFLHGNRFLIAYSPGIHTNTYKIWRKIHSSTHSRNVYAINLLNHSRWHNLSDYIIYVSAIAQSIEMVLLFEKGWQMTSSNGMCECSHVCHSGFWLSDEILEPRLIQSVRIRLSYQLVNRCTMEWYRIRW